MPRRSLARLYKDEFTGYSLAKFQQDLLAGLTVAAVALPLALAFGVASGASAAAGLVTAILAGLIMGLLTGAPFQISGPTGAMSAVLIVLVSRYGLEGIWVAGLLSGALLLIIGTPAPRPFHRLHPRTCHQRLYLGYRPHYLHRPDRQPARHPDSRHRNCRAKISGIFQRRLHARLPDSDPRTRCHWDDAVHGQRNGMRASPPPCLGLSLPRFSTGS